MVNLVDYLVNQVYHLGMDKESLNQQPTARLWIYLFRRFEKRLLAMLHQKGYGDITAGHFNILRHLDPGGLRLVDLAADAAMSKQAAGKVVGHLVELGFLRLEKDPGDARAKRVVYTKKGRNMMRLAVETVRTMELEYEHILGKAAYRQLRRHLIKLLLHCESSPWT